MTWLSGPTRCARRPLTWSVFPAGAAAWQNALQIRPRPPRGARYRYGLRRSWARPPCDRRERRAIPHVSCLSHFFDTLSVLQSTSRSVVVSLPSIPFLPALPPAPPKRGTHFLVLFYRTLSSSPSYR